MVDNEIMALSERLFDATTPNLFNQITVRLQRRTYSSATTDDAPERYDLSFWIETFLIVDL